MISPVLTDALHSSWSTLNNACNELTHMNVRELSQRVNDIAVTAFFVLCGALLFLSNSSLFVLGVMVAVVNRDAMQQVLDRVTTVWLAQDLKIRSVVITGAVFAWPITMAVAALLIGGKLGCMAQQPANAPVSA